MQVETQSPQSQPQSSNGHSAPSAFYLTPPESPAPADPEAPTDPAPVPPAGDEPAAPEPSQSRQLLTRPPEREQRELMCELTEPERLLRGERLAQCEIEQEGLREKRRGLNGGIAELRAEATKLAEVIDAGEESRVVECTWIEDAPQNRFKLVRQDTGAEVDSRAMTFKDHQGDLFAAIGGAPAPANDNGAASEDFDQETGEVLSMDGPESEDDADEDDEDEAEATSVTLPVAAAPKRVTKPARSAKPQKTTGKKALKNKPKRKPGNTRHSHA